MLKQRRLLWLALCLTLLLTVGTAFGQGDTAVFSFSDGSLAFEHPAEWIAQEEEGIAILATSEEAGQLAQRSEPMERDQFALLLYSPLAFAQILSSSVDSDLNTPLAIVQNLLEDGDLTGEIEEFQVNGFDFVYVDVTGSPELEGVAAAFGILDSPAGFILLAIQTGGRLSDYRPQVDAVLDSITSGDIEPVVQPTSTRRPPFQQPQGGGTSVESELTFDTTSRYYSVELSRGDTITIELSADFDTVVNLFAPGDYESGGIYTESNDDSGDASFGNLNSRIEDFEVDEAGTWVIQATSFAQLGIGEFTLTVRGDEDSYDLAQMAAIAAIQATPTRGAPVTPAGDGSSVTGVLTDDETQQRYTIELSEGDTITVELSADYDTLLRLYAPGDEDGAPTIDNDDSGDPDFGRFNSRIEDFTVSESGTWTIEANSFAEIGRGEYLLVVRGDEDSYELVPVGGEPIAAPTRAPLLNATPTPTRGAPVTPAGDGSSVTGELTEDETFRLYQVELNEGDTITLELSADYDTVVRLYAPGMYAPGAVATAFNDDSGDVDFGTLNSRLVNFPVNESGTWVIEANSFAQIGRGDFLLTVRGDEDSYDIQPFGEAAATPEPRATQEAIATPETPVITGENVLLYNQPVEGTLARSEREVEWRFAGSAGDVVTISMVAADLDTLDPRVYLYTADEYAAGGNELIENDDSRDDDFGFRNARIQDFELPETGEYVVVATCFVACEGDYTLSVESEAAVVQVQPTPAPTGDEVRQWAASASASSEYSSDAWSAAQATGEPDTGECADIRTAWASAESLGVDSLTLEYTTPVIPTQVNIYQTLNPGSITSVVLITVGGDEIELPNSADPPGNTDCPGVFTVDVTGVDQRVNAVTINVDQTIGGGWNEIDAVELVGVSLGGGAQAPVTDLETLLTDARAAWDNAEWQTAVELYTQAIAADPQNGNSYFFRGYALYYLEDYENALTDFNQALEIGTDDTAWVFNLRGLTYDLLGQYELAIADFESALDISPNYEAVIGNLAWLYGNRLDDWKQYTDLYRRLVEIAPEDSGYYNGVGWGLVQQRRYREAIQQLDIALELDPENASAYDSRGWAYLGIENYDAAEADFRAAIERGEFYSYYGLAELYHAQGDDVQALENLQTYLDEAGDSAVEGALALLETLQ